MRLWTVLALTGLILLGGASVALGHATLVRSTPAPGSSVDVAPAGVTLRFSEPVQLLTPTDASVVTSSGRTVSGAPLVSPSDASVVEIPLSGDLADGTYTVRYTVIGADSHVIPGVFVFAVGPDEPGEPYSAGVSERRGPSETSAWSVVARFLELAALGGLVGLFVFRWLVWMPSASSAGGRPSPDAMATLRWGRDAFWTAFGVLSLAAMASEGYLLLVQSATVNGVRVIEVIRDTPGVSRVLESTEFGALLQLRGALLFGVFALGASLFIRENRRTEEIGGRDATGVVLSALIGVLLLGVIVSVTAQGHPRVASPMAIQVAAQALHLVGAGVWLTGLAMIVWCFARLRRVAPAAGPMLSAQLLRRFSRVALVAVAAIVASGIVRSASELGDPSELWTTAYGRSILYKVALLCPIAGLAFYNRRIVTSLRGVERPPGATMTRVARTAGGELALGLAVVLIAAVLLAQPPGQ